MIPSKDAWLMLPKLTSSGGEWVVLWRLVHFGSLDSVAASGFCSDAERDHSEWVEISMVIPKISLKTVSTKILTDGTQET